MKSTTYIKNKDYNKNDIQDNDNIELLAHIKDMNDVELTLDEDDLLLEKLNSTTLWNDIYESISIGKYMIFIGGLIGFGFSFYFTIWRYKVAAVENINTPHTWDSLSLIRPVLSKEKKYEVYSNILYGETSLQLPNDESISMRFYENADKYGSQQLPELFYHGVMFSIGLGDSHNVPYSSVKPSVIPTISVNEEQEQNTRKLTNMHLLFQSITELKPKPIYITPRTSRNNNTKWYEDGYILYYSYKQLHEEGLLSNNDPLQPWRRVSESILTIARNFKQFYITVYYANAFGPSTTNQMHKIVENNNKFKRKLGIHEKMHKQKEKDIPYRLHQSYDGSYTTESVLQSNIDGIDDEIKYYKSIYPSGPKRKQEDIQKTIENEQRRKLKSTMSNVYQPHTGESIISAVTEAGRALKEKNNQEKHKHHGLRDIHNHKYENIIQMVLPTHTGLNEIKSSCVVWMSKFQHQHTSEAILKTFEMKTGRRLGEEFYTSHNHDSSDIINQSSHLQSASRQLTYKDLKLDLPYTGLGHVLNDVDQKTEKENAEEEEEVTDISISDIETKPQNKQKSTSRNTKTFHYFDYLFSVDEKFQENINNYDIVYRKPWN